MVVKVEASEKRVKFVDLLKLSSEMATVLPNMLSRDSFLRCERVDGRPAKVIQKFGYRGCATIIRFGKPCSTALKYFEFIDVFWTVRVLRSYRIPRSNP